MFGSNTECSTDSNAPIDSEEKRSEEEKSHFSYLTMRHLLRLAYAMSDLRLKINTDSFVTEAQRAQISESLTLQKKIDPFSKDGVFLREFILLATSMCHSVCSSREKLDRDRQLCIERRSEALALEAGVNTVGALLRLSGQLFLIGGLTGIVGWLFLNESKIEGTNEVHIAMSTAIAFASMIAGMAMQLRAMSKSNKAINFEYARERDVAKETQVTSLLQGLTKTKLELAIVMEERFGKSVSIEDKTDTSTEVYQFELLRDRDNPEVIDPWWQDFANYFKRLCGKAAQV